MLLNTVYTFANLIRSRHTWVIFAFTLFLSGTAAFPASAAPFKPGTSFFEPFDRIDSSRWYVSDGWVNGNHQGCTWSRDNVRVERGVLTLRHTKAPNHLRGLKCAEIRTNSRLGFGLYEARIRTAAGSGLNTAMFTYSGPPLTDVHDEIDFEFLGKTPNKVQLNYFVSARGGHESIESLGTNASVGFNNYAFEWLPESIKWYVNGHLVRVAAGPMRPSVAGQFMLTLWSGSSDVDAWLGKFVDPRNSISADIDWFAYTRLGEKCRFPESMSCAAPR